MSGSHHIVVGLHQALQVGRVHRLAQQVLWREMKKGHVCMLLLKQQADYWAASTASLSIS